MSRATSTATTSLLAACRDCGWTTDADNGMGNAARHHDATGHTLDVDVARRITYGDPYSQPAAQTSPTDLIDA